MAITSLENNILFILTVILLIGKAIFALYLGKTVYEKKKNLGYLEFDFLFGFFIFIVFLFISRIFYMIFDSFLTQFDPSLQYLPQNIIFWKLGSFFSLIGVSFILFIIERAIFKFKFKCIPSIFVIISNFIILFTPSNTLIDFRILSILLFVSFSVSLIIPITFIYNGIKYPEIRKVSIMLGVGALIFFIATGSVSHILSDPIKIFLSEKWEIFKYFPFFIGKLIGLAIVSYFSTNLFIFNYFMKLE
ncbi:MAG: hypothetical protein EU541_02420 [Promethearchaeota archaeon]|nr:MAG: hypothetical protein EU541_02420 [Candidatus Lokiarchaeota archaeon]